MAGMIDKRLEVDSFYTMFTPRQVQKALGCSRATLYRTLKKAGIERYYIPNHPGGKYIWGCSLYKLVETPIVKKTLKKYYGQDKLPSSNNIEKIARVAGMPFENIKEAIVFGWIPVVNGEIAWWYENVVKGLLKLPLPSK